jgi:hypothetical protein
VVVHDFHAVGSIVVPSEAHAPLGVDADAVLAQSVTFEGFQRVAGWNAQTVQIRSVAACSCSNLRRATRVFAKAERHGASHFNLCWRLGSRQ